MQRTFDMGAVDLGSSINVVPYQTGKASRRRDKTTLRRSSSSVDQAVPGGRCPSTAMNIMLRVVVCPPPRRLAVTKKQGRSGMRLRSISESARRSVCMCQRSRGHVIEPFVHEIAQCSSNTLVSALFALWKQPDSSWVFEI